MTSGLLLKDNASGNSISHWCCFPTAAIASRRRLLQDGTSVRVEIGGPA